MKNLLNILREEYKILENAEREIFIEDPSLDLVAEANKLHHELSNSEKGLEAAIKEYKKKHCVRIKKSLSEVLKVTLANYENRTIHVDKGDVDSEGVINALNGFKGISFVVSYKNHIFDPLDRQLWQRHNPKEGHRIVFYALDNMDGREIAAIKKIASLFGYLVADKRKKYNKYDSRVYRVDSKDGLHMRPALGIVKTANKYSGDVWLRTDAMECNAKSIMSVLTMVIKKDNRVRVLYKPKENSTEFYNEIESIQYDSKPLLIPYKKG